jgi:hypothetical protein
MLQLNKAAGVNGIVSAHVINCFPSLIINLKFLFHIILHHTYVPEICSCDILMPIIIYKSGDVAALANYTPTTLSPVISKIFDMVLL